MRQGTSAVEFIFEHALPLLEHGCVTGSCMLKESPTYEGWVHEVDVFSYTENAWTANIQALLCAGFIFGEANSPRLARQSLTKWNRKLTSNKSSNWLSTVTLYHPHDGACINVSHKQGSESILEVLQSFDMSIVMVGTDLSLDVGHVDLRTTFSDSVMCAKPNPVRFANIIENMSTWQASMLLRQWDRVIKYDARGYDTLPMAIKYKEILETIIAEGSIFDSEDSLLRFQDFDTVYTPILQEKIIPWIEAKKAQP